MADITGVANLQEVLQQKQAIIDAANLNVVSSNQFVYLAGFDGTNNDELLTNGDPQTTNVRQLILQAEAARVGRNSLRIAP
jgi:hypothetical protein